MALTHTILVTLATESHTGYEIWKTFEETLNSFWKASQQQIYRELGKMEKKDCLIQKLFFKKVVLIKNFIQLQKKEKWSYKSG
ncbi:PadR family transcriptional regulator [Crocosphaera watsonii WH 8501]|uniref:PadR family transcriptional regulator n=1 Tax=Crocosphaera watsonii TaxID=263511 RepID=UPI000039C3A3